MADTRSSGEPYVLWHVGSGSPAAKEDPGAHIAVGGVPYVVVGVIPGAPQSVLYLRPEGLHRWSVGW